MIDYLHKDDEVREYFFEVLQDLRKNYNLESENAVDYISKSTFWKMMQKHPDFVLHYNAEHWSKDIMKERNSIYQMN